MQETKVILFSMRLIFNNPQPPAGVGRDSCKLHYLNYNYYLEFSNNKALNKKKFAALKLRVGSPETTREAPYNKGEDIVRPGRKLLLSPRICGAIKV